MVIKHRQAMILTAYRDFDVLAAALRAYSVFFDCYVHIDKKSTVPDDFYAQIQELENVYTVCKYSVNWGSYNHVRAVLHLLKQAACGEYTYYHILAANTLPCKPLKTVAAFFENKDRNFLETYPIGNSLELATRQSFFWATDVNNTLVQGFFLFLRRCQKYLHLERSLIFRNKGYLYCHLTGELVKYVLEEMDSHPYLVFRFMTSRIAEEFFFQYFANNSHFVDTIENNCLIYSDWSECRPSPRTLSEKDFDFVTGVDDLFCRKVSDISLAERLLEL